MARLRPKHEQTETPPATETVVAEAGWPVSYLTCPHLRYHLVS